MKQPFTIPSLDGMRGVAVAIVFLSHCETSLDIPGGFGVTIFFFLSGYLITTLMRTEYQDGGSLSLKNFYMRRVYRILPPLYIVLSLSVLLALTGVLPNTMTLEAVLAQYFHLTNYYYELVGSEGFAPGTGVLWSLAVEEHYYLLFPALFLFLAGRVTPKQMALVFAAICGAVLAWRAFVVFELDAVRYSFKATETRIDSIMFGCILAMFCNPVLDDTPDLPRPVEWLALGGSMLVLYYTLTRGGSFRAFGYTLQGIALVPIFFLAIKRHESWVFRWLSWRPMRALGLISYTFYLSHVICLDLVAAAAGNASWQSNIAGALLAAGFCAIMYFMVETRFAELRKKLHGRSPQQTAQQSQPPG